MFGLLSIANPKSWLECTIKTAAEVRLFRRMVVMDTVELEVMEVVMLDTADAVALAEVDTADAVVMVAEEIEVCNLDWSRSDGFILVIL